MKILHVEAGMHLYGGALQVNFLLRGLQARGVRSVLACAEGSEIGLAAAAHADIRALPMGGDADIGLIRRLARLIDEVSPDVIHLHSRRGADVLGGLAGRLRGIPVVLSRRVDNRESRLLVAVKYRLYDRVVTISDGIRAVLAEEGVPASKLRCVLSAVDTEQYRPDASFREELIRQFDLPSDALLVGMAAQFIARKGHDTLLDALPAVLASAQRDVRVLLFGQGPDQTRISERIAASPLLRRHVHIAGFRRDLPRVLPCLDLLVHPAFMEGLGVALLQAAACAVPIVAGRAGGIPEIVKPGMNGELIEPGDSEGLSAAMSRLLASHALRRQYGLAARQWVTERFSIDAMVDGNLAVYRELLTRDVESN